MPSWEDVLSLDDVEALWSYVVAGEPEQTSVEIPESQIYTGGPMNRRGNQRSTTFIGNPSRTGLRDVGDTR